MLLGAGFAIAIVLVSCARAASGVGSLDRSLAGALAVRGITASDSAALVVDLQSGKVLYARNPDLPLEPASNEKLCVTYTALVELGTPYRFPTELLGAGRRSGTTWRGNLVLKGFGDPSLTSSDLGRLAGILWREGVHRVTGDIVADASYFDDRTTAPGWLASFAGVESPPLWALEVDRGQRDGAATADPPLAAASDLEALLEARGIAVGGAITGTAPAAAPVLATIFSEPLPRLLEFMDHASDNFTAEMLLKAIGAKQDGVGTTAGGARVVREVLASARVPLGGVRIVDGSGLSRWDRVTARELGALLVTIWHDPTTRAIVLGALPVAGESGTLADRMRTAPARGLVRAKTGTTDIASALSGYVAARFGFVVIENGNPVDWVAARAAQDRFADTLAGQAASG